MPIFQDAQGLATKFFIQKDLPEQIQAELCETIASLGGRVETKVPRAGYLLVQPATLEEERLRLCWATRDRPERYFVPYTFVEACKIAGLLLHQIFLEPTGDPMKMHIHASIANVNARAALASRILHSGGDPTASMQNAKIILADPNTEVFQHLVQTYQQTQDKYVESYLWVKKSIERGMVQFTPMVYKNPGGRRPGEERIQFSEDDEERLCQWIAMKIPYKETGGRTGNRLYQQLVEMGNDTDYSWVNRHTWQSWRERYKKNAERLDKRITHIVDERKPLVGEKGQYAFVRQAEEKPKRTRKKAAAAAAAVPDEGEMPLEGEFIPPAMPYPMPAPDPSSSHNLPEREEDETSEWAVRIGNDPPPAWAKRKAEEEEGEPPAKRPRSADHEAQMHIVDRGLLAIAHDTRFTHEEVREFYNTSGDMQRTRNRFQRMRDVLTRMLAAEEGPAVAGGQQLVQQAGDA